MKTLENRKEKKISSMTSFFHVTISYECENMGRENYF